MNINRRRLIYLSFIVFFIIATAVLLLALQGFRYNPQKYKLERRGGLSINTLPNQAVINLNNILMPETSPATIQSLQPGNYDVRLQTNNSQPWHKTLAVKPSLVTFTGQVRLWPITNHQPTKIYEAVDYTLQSPNGQNLLYHISSGINYGWWLLNLTSGKSLFLNRQTADTYTKLEWSPNSRQILINQNTTTGPTIQIMDLEKNTLELVTLPTAATNLIVHWGKNESNLYFSNHTELYQFNLSNETVKSIWRGKLIDFKINNEVAFIITTNQNSSSTLKLLNLNNLQIIPTTDGPMATTNLTFLNHSDAWVTLFAEDRHTLYLLRSPLINQEYIKTLPEVTGLDWSINPDQILLTNNFELWRYTISTNKLDLILRMSKPLTAARLYQNEPYILFASDNNLWTVELDTRDQQQQWLLATYPKPIKNLFIDQSGKTVTVQTADALYRVNLSPTITLNQPAVPPTN